MNTKEELTLAQAVALWEQAESAVGLAEEAYMNAQDDLAKAQAAARAAWEEVQAIKVM